MLSRVARAGVGGTSSGAGRVTADEHKRRYFLVAGSAYPGCLDAPSGVRTREYPHATREACRWMSKAAAGLGSSRDDRLWAAIEPWASNCKVTEETRRPIWAGTKWDVYDARERKHFDFQSRFFRSWRILRHPCFQHTSRSTLKGSHRAGVLSFPADFQSSPSAPARGSVSEHAGSGQVHLPQCVTSSLRRERRPATMHESSPSIHRLSLRL